MVICDQALLGLDLPSSSSMVIFYQALLDIDLPCSSLLAIRLCLTCTTTYERESPEGKRDLRFTFSNPFLLICVFFPSCFFLETARGIKHATACVERRAGEDCARVGGSVRLCLSTKPGMQVHTSKQ